MSMEKEVNKILKEKKVNFLKKDDLSRLKAEILNDFTIILSGDEKEKNRIIFGKTGKAYKKSMTESNPALREYFSLYNNIMLDITTQAGLREDPRKKGEAFFG